MEGGSEGVGEARTDAASTSGTGKFSPAKHCAQRYGRSARLRPRRARQPRGPGQQGRNKVCVRRAPLPSFDPQWKQAGRRHWGRR